MAMARGSSQAVKLLWRRLGLVALLLLVLLALSGWWNVFKKERESRALRQQSESTVNSLSEQEAQLKADIASLKTERGKEAVLRAQYAVGKKGEELVVIVDPGTPKPVQASSSVMQWVRTFLPFW